MCFKVLLKVFFALIEVFLLKRGKGRSQLVRVVQVVQLMKLHLITAVLNPLSSRSVSQQIARGSVSHKTSRIS